MSQCRTAIIYIETYTIRNAHDKAGAICGELHYPGCNISNVSIIGTKDYMLAVIAEAARLLEVLQVKAENISETSVIVYTSCNQFVWEWKDVVHETPKRNKQQWHRFIMASSKCKNVEIKGPGYLSRTVREKAKFLLLRRRGNGKS